MRKICYTDSSAITYLRFAVPFIKVILYINVTWSTKRYKILAVLDRASKNWVLLHSVQGSSSAKIQICINEIKITTFEKKN